MKNKQKLMQTPEIPVSSFSTFFGLCFFILISFHLLNHS